jgi:hypothetical protein
MLTFFPRLRANSFLLGLLLRHRCHGRFCSKAWARFSLGLAYLPVSASQFIHCWNFLTGGQSKKHQLCEDCIDFSKRLPHREKARVAVSYTGG